MSLVCNLFEDVFKREAATPLHVRQQAVAMSSWLHSRSMILCKVELVSLK